MYYPNHHIRSYCQYLGSLTIGNNKYDLGVYQDSAGHLSHAIIFGNQPQEYYSGDFTINQNRWMHLIARINYCYYLAYLKDLLIPDNHN